MYFVYISLLGKAYSRWFINKFLIFFIFNSLWDFDLDIVPLQSWKPLLFFHSKIHNFSHRRFIWRMCFFFYLCNLHTVFIAFRKQNEKKETLHSLCEMADHGKVDDIVCKVNTYLHTKYIRRYVMKIKKNFL